MKDVAHWVEGDRLKITQYTQAMFQLKYPVEPTEPPRSPLQTLPTLYDLPSEFRELDEVSMQLVSLASRDVLKLMRQNEMQLLFPFN